eukprot:m.118760 g.118760  ORF g.118760 m.118760 type:complete len:489 (+) comp16131_c0_seq2:59-1525(+)
MSLQDQLLADLNELDDVDEEPQDDIEEDDDDAMEAGPSILDTADLKVQSVRSIAKLWDSARMKSVLEGITKFLGVPRAELFGPVEEDPEYKLILEANSIVQEIDNEINVLHKYVRDCYAKRFRELEQLVLNPMDYVRTVQLLKNDLKAMQELHDILDPSTVLVVNMTAQSAGKEQLTADELSRTLEACEMAINLSDAKMKILAYVESRMDMLAPNLSYICGAPTAAKLMGVAGGLTLLSKIPACNILVLGATKRALTGFSTAQMLPHTGFIYYSDFVQSFPEDLRKKAARLVSAKIALAARVDAYGTGDSRTVTVGRELREDIEKKLDKAMEPPPAKLAKPLPAPDDLPGKRRGGKRVRKQKESMAMTEMRKQANRMAFGQIEEDILQDDLGYSIGELGKSGSGQFRIAESKQKKGRISKKLQQEIRRHGGLSSIRGVSSVIAGTASVAFTPAAGLEIVNPHAAEARLAANAPSKYFGTTSTFANMGK